MSVRIHPKNRRGAVSISAARIQETAHPVPHIFWHIYRLGSIWGVLCPRSYAARRLLTHALVICTSLVRQSSTKSLMVLSVPIACSFKD